MKIIRKRGLKKVKIEHNKNILAIIIVLIIFLIAILMYLNTKNNILIGGDKDDYGCLIAAGYNYNETIGACIREWELDESQRNASQIAVESLGFEQGLTINSVTSMDCIGCFEVDLNIAGEGKTKQISIVDWKVSEVEYLCFEDNDCVADSCCHSSGCVGIEDKPNCSGIYCTAECVANTLDCNQGECKCLNNKCTAVIR